MGRNAFPHYWAERQYWVATVHGKPNTRLTEGKCKKTKESEAAAYKRFHQLSGAEPVTKSDNKLFSEVVDLFLDFVHQHRAAATFEWYRAPLEKFVKANKGLRVKDMKVKVVSDWANTNKNHSPTTIRNRIQAVKGAMKWALEQQIVDSNPIVGLKQPKPQNKKVYVTSIVFEEILKHVHSHEFRQLLVAAHLTGCRPQEIVRVEKRHFDSKNSRWIFPKEESKNKKIPRAIYLQGEALAITKELVEKYPSGPIFRNANGKQWNKGSTSNQFGRIRQRMAKASGEGKLTEKKLMKQQRYCLYSLRHGFATEALKNGTDSVLIGKLMGHVDASMVATIYSHPEDDPKYMLDIAKQVKRSTAASGAKN